MSIRLIPARVRGEWFQAQEGKGLGFYLGSCQRRIAPMLAMLGVGCYQFAWCSSCSYLHVATAQFQSLSLTVVGLFVV